MTGVQTCALPIFVGRERVSAQVETDVQKGLRVLAGCIEILYETDQGCRTVRRNQLQQRSDWGRWPSTDELALTDTKRSLSPATMSSEMARCAS